jgi:hypothetical protein
MDEAAQAAAVALAAARELPPAGVPAPLGDPLPGDRRSCCC